MHKFGYMISLISRILNNRDIDIYIIFIKFTVLGFSDVEIDLICTVMLRHLSQFRHVIVCYYVRKKLFPRLNGILSLQKIPFLFPSNITKKHQKCNIKDFVQVRPTHKVGAKKSNNKPGQRQVIRL